MIKYFFENGKVGHRQLQLRRQLLVTVKSRPWLVECFENPALGRVNHYILDQVIKRYHTTRYDTNDCFFNQDTNYTLD